MSEEDPKLQTDQPADFEERARWLDRGHRYRPQPYVRLAEVLSAHGYETQARKVLIWKEDRELGELKACIHQGKKTTSPQPVWQMLAYELERIVAWLLYCCRWIFSKCFGFGLSPNRAILTLVLSIFVGWVAFNLMSHLDVLVVSQQPVASVFAQGKLVAPVALEGESAIRCGDTIQPLIYALDVFVPLFDLKEADRCEIEAVRSARPANAAAVLLFRYFKVVYAIWGWVCTSLSLITFSGVMKSRLAQT
jgi:hypothetical protein